MRKYSKSHLNIYQGYIDTVIEEVMDKYDVNPYKVPMEIYTYFESEKQVLKTLHNILQNKVELIYAKEKSPFNII